MTPAEVAIVGAGPIGIELAVALKRRGIPYLHFDAQQVGQTMYWWPPQTRWFSSNDRIAIAGAPLQTVDQNKATREDYLRYLRSIVLEHDLQIHTFEPVAAIARAGDDFTLTTHPLSGERTYHARRVVLATGGTATPRKLNVPGEDLPHVSHHLEDPHKYFRKKVLVVGGRNSAVEVALRCHAVGAHVALSYRGDSIDANGIKYWLYPEIKSLISSRKVPAYFNTTVQRIESAQVILQACTSNDTFGVETDFVLLMVGYLADMSLFRNAGVSLAGEDETPVFDEQTMETNVPGLYVAGTAVGGTQSRYRVFLENCHIHVDRIVAAITGSPPPATPELPSRPES